MFSPLKAGDAAHEVTGSASGKPDIFRVRWDRVSAEFREGLVKIEDVAPIRDAADLYFRMEGPNRAIYAQRDPKNPNGAITSIHTALTDGLAGSLQDIISGRNSTTTPNTLTCYSVTNWPDSSGGGSSKTFITNVANLVCDNNPSITTRSTLSPMHGFRDWVEGLADRTKEPVLPLGTRGLQMLDTLLGIRSPEEMTHNKGASHFLHRLAAFYLTSGAEKDGKFKANGISRVHLANGARVERVVLGGDVSEQGWARSFSVVPNFVYDPAQVAKNAADYKTGTLACSDEVAALRKGLARISGPGARHDLHL